MEYRGTGRKIYDGSESGVPYLHGVVVRQDFAEKYPEVVVAFIEAVLDAGQWIDADPLCAADQLEKWTGVEKECSTSTSRKEAILRSIPMIKQPWVDA